MSQSPIGSLYVGRRYIGSMTLRQALKRSGRILVRTSVPNLGTKAGEMSFVISRAMTLGEDTQNPAKSMHVLDSETMMSGIPYDVERVGSAADKLLQRIMLTGVTKAGLPR